MARILIADDAALIRILVSRSLVGHETIQASDGDEALQLLLEHQPDIAILDWIMPGLDGIEICKAARNDPSLANTQFVVMTSRETYEVEQDAREAGVNYFLRKPIMPRQLAELVDSILKKKSNESKESTD